jgi:hypothetical protein
MTLALDVSAKPISLIPVKEAVSRLAADLINSRSSDSTPMQVIHEDPSRRFRSQKLDIAAPVVVLFPDCYVELNDVENSKVSRRVMFARDEYSCQYCDFIATSGKAMKQLTLDHVKPARLFHNRGQATTWENVTTACQPCNIRKGGQLPRDCGMMPRNTPVKPNYVQLKFAGRVNDVQRDYIREYFENK